MNINFWLECINCSKKYQPAAEVRYTCDCGGLLEVKRDLSKVDGKKLLETWESRWGAKNGVYSSGVWRYKELIVDIDDKYIVTKQEGNTRLYDAGLAGEYAGLKNIQC